jgi:hypothetical protein
MNFNQFMDDVRVILNNINPKAAAIREVLNEWRDYFWMGFSPRDAVDDALQCE